MDTFLSPSLPPLPSLTPSPTSTQNVQQKMLIDEKDREITHRNRLLVQAKTAIDSLKSELMETKGRVVELESERVSMKNQKIMTRELERTRRSDESARDALDSLRSQLSDKKREIAQHEVCERENALKTSQLQRRLSERDSTIRSLRVQLKASSSARSKLEDRIVSEEASGDRKIQIEALQAKVKSKATQIRRLETECTKLHQQLMIRSESANLHSIKDNAHEKELREVKRKHDQELTELVEAKRSVEKRLRDAEHRLSLSSAECVELATLLESERKRSRERLEETSNEAKAELAQWAQKSVSWKSESRRRNSAIEKNEAKVLKLQRRIADMCGRLEVMEQSRQEAQERLNNARKQFEVEMREANDKLAETEDRVDEWKLRCQELEKKVEECVKQESEARDELRSQKLLMADMEKRREIEDDEVHMNHATDYLRRDENMKRVYEDLRNALGLAPSFREGDCDFEPLLREIRRRVMSSSGNDEDEVDAVVESKKLTREMCRHLETEFRKRTKEMSRYVDKFEDRLDGLESMASKMKRVVMKSFSSSGMKKQNDVERNVLITIRPQLERYKNEVERLREILTQREVELSQSNDARDAAISKQMRVAENNRLLILEVKERGEDLKDDRVALKNAQKKIQSLQKRFHYVTKANEELKRRIHEDGGEERKTPRNIKNHHFEKMTTPILSYPKSPWHSRVESVNSTGGGGGEKRRKGKKVNFSECTPIPLQERSFNEIHSTMINNLGDLSRDLKRGASVILSSPSLRRSGRRTRSMNLGGGF